MKIDKQAFIDGQMLLIDKPLEWTSFNAVNKVRNSLRRYLGIKKIKVGHAGTLDPLASGLLILCTGKMTKRLNEFMGLPKTYTGSITLGETRPSYDLETQPNAQFPTDHITEQAVMEAAQKFTGKIQQFPPAFSAIKKEGKKAYEAASEGNNLDLSAREVEIHRFDILGISWPEIHFEVECSKGTYIRSLAHDMGKELQSGAYLSALRRTAIGEYKVDDGISPNEFAALLEEKSASDPGD